MTERYFAFGANMHPATLRRRGIEPRRSSPARLDGYRLVFDMPGIPWVEPAFASVTPADDHVWGVLYELDPGDLGRLRRYEGAAYQEVGVEVSLDTGRIAARTFVNAGRARERRPSRRYLGLIIDAARVRSLPAAWVERIESHPRCYVPVVHEVWGVAFHAVDLAHRWVASPASRRE